MVRSLQDVKQTARRYSDYISTKLPVRKVLLYGSYAKGTPREDSDIDIAVFIDSSDHKKGWSLPRSYFILPVILMWLSNPSVSSGMST